MAFPVGIMGMSSWGRGTQQDILTGGGRRGDWLSPMHFFFPSFPFSVPQLPFSIPPSLAPFPSSGLPCPFFFFLLFHFPSFIPSDKMDGDHTKHFTIYQRLNICTMVSIRCFFSYPACSSDQFYFWNWNKLRCPLMNLLSEEEVHLIHNLGCWWKLLAKVPGRMN